MAAKDTGNEEFIKASEDVKLLSTKPGFGFHPLFRNDSLLELYGLFKQSVVGDCDTARPGMFDLQGKAKWDAWSKLSGMPKPDAQQKYITVVKVLQAK